MYVKTNMNPTLIFLRLITIVNDFATINKQNNTYSLEVTKLYYF